MSNDAKGYLLTFVQKIIERHYVRKRPRTTRTALLWIAKMLSVILASGVPSASALGDTFDGLADPGFDPGSLFQSPNDLVRHGLGVQSDGRFLVMGNSDDTGHRLFYRYNSDGTLDTGFIVARPGDLQYGGGLWVQPDDKILYAYQPTGSKFILRRANADGSADGTFSQAIFEGNGNYLTLDLAVQPDGKIVAVGGFDTLNGSGAPGIVRLNANGSVDTSLNAGSGIGRGGAITAGPASAVNAVVAVQPDGGILVAAKDMRAFNRTACNALVRLHQDGSVDRSFRAFGSATVDQSPPKVMALALQSNGMILVACGSERPVIARLYPDGAVDSGFADVHCQSAPGVVSLLPLANGKIVVAGNFLTDFYVGNIQATSKNILRLNSDGTFDGTFASGEGVVGGGAIAKLLPSGNILVGGSFTRIDTTPRLNLAVVLNTAGPAPSGFSIATQPQSQTPALGRSVSLYAVPAGTPPFSYHWKRHGSFIGATGQTLVFDAFSGVDADDYSVVVTNPNGSVESASASLSLPTAPSAGAPEGTLDTTFQPLSSIRAGDVVQVVSDPSGNIVVGGYQGNGGYDDFIGFSRLFRVFPSGVVDPTFLPLGAPFFSPTLRALLEDLSSFAVQGDGKILVWLNRSGPNLYRLNMDGSIDSAFGAVRVTQGLVLPLPNGKIIVSGQVTAPNGSSNSGLARLNSDGTLDSGFDIGSGLVGGSNPSQPTVGSGFVQADGKILIAGDFVSVNGLARRHVARLGANGAVDTDFVPDSGLGSIGPIRPGLNSRVYVWDQGVIRRLYPNGSIDPAWTPSSSTPTVGDYRDFQTQADGKVLVVGANRFGSGGLARLGWNGAVDSAFDPGTGVCCRPTSGLNGWGSAALLQPDGNVVVGGSFLQAEGVARPGLARFKNSVDQLASPPINVPPYARPDTLVRFNNTRVAKVLAANLLSNDADLDLDTLSITGVGNATPVGASVAILGNFAVYTAPGAGSGNGGFTYTLSDGTGGHTVSGVVTVLESAPPVGDGASPASVIHTGSDYVLTFVGVPGRSYSVQYATETMPPYNWRDFSPPALFTAPANGVFVRTDLNPPEPLRFYRAVAQP